jgi:two-component system nitrogen regulation sensor histidine kinase GlnL
MIKPRAEIQGVRISHNFSVLPVMNADPFQIEHALFNIINNAFEAMPDGGTLNIKTSLKWENNIDYIVAEISDTGKGIPEEEMRELSDNPERNDKGFGIFLSREVVRSHKGKLFWESARDRGTTFKILLPVENNGQSE